MKLCPVIIFPGIVKDCPEMRNLPKIFLRSFENVVITVCKRQHDQQQYQRKVINAHQCNTLGTILRFPQDITLHLVKAVSIFVHFRAFDRCKPQAA